MQRGRNARKPSYKDKGQTNRHAGLSQENLDGLANKYIHSDIPDPSRSGKYLCENRISLTGFKRN